LNSRHHDFSESPEYVFWGWKTSFIKEGFLSVVRSIPEPFSKNLTVNQAKPPAHKLQAKFDHAFSPQNTNAFVEKLRRREITF